MGSLVSFCFFGRCYSTCIVTYEWFGGVTVLFTYTTSWQLVYEAKLSLTGPLSP